ncbi:hypothetical protein [Streptosporangium roseum]|uniref:hypothetical protein n=1 Tax=Streptosporangium roseum TaxID=2001 RepID=UPI0012DBFB8C|nr:hypothetical protein [Streptosporangium roseum]
MVTHLSESTFSWVIRQAAGQFYALAGSSPEVRHRQGALTKVRVVSSGWATVPASKQ